MRWFNRRLNEDYARAAVRDCVLRGESPICSHLLLTQPGILRDEDPMERELGIGCGHQWMRVADAVVVYGDLGMSGGMREGVKAATLANKPIEYRSLAEWVGPQSKAL